MTASDTLLAIEQSIRDATGDDFALSGSAPVAGGCISQTLEVCGENTRYFVKLAPLANAAMFDAEADGLAAIAATRTIRTPEVIAQGQTDTTAFLVLEFLDIHPLVSPEDGRRFARALADLHRQTGAQFGWHCDNFIGQTPQHNAPDEYWSRFYIEHRLRPQFALTSENGYDIELNEIGERLCARIPSLFLDYRPQPSLLHGDLWHGNAGMNGAGEPVVFDPAVHYGDLESDLAMCALFGGFPTSFHAEYQAANPLAPDSNRRRMLYSLYHVLNHLNLFGRSYLGEALRLAKRLDDAL